MSNTDNKKLVAAVFEAMNLATIGEVDMEETIRWTAPDWKLNGEVMGQEGYLARTVIMAEAFPDSVWLLDDMIAEEDKVVVRWTFRGTHMGTLETVPVPPTHKQVEFNGISVYNIKDGLITETWESFDRFNVLMQIGAIPVPA